MSNLSTIRLFPSDAVSLFRRLQRDQVNTSSGDSNNVFHENKKKRFEGRRSNPDPLDDDVIFRVKSRKDVGNRWEDLTPSSSKFLS